MTAKEMFEKFGYLIIKNNNQVLQYNCCVDFGNGGKGAYNMFFDKINKKIFLGATDITNEYKGYNKRWVNLIDKQIEELGWK